MAVSSFTFPAVDSGGTREKYAAIGRSLLGVSETADDFDHFMKGYASTWSASTNGGSIGILTTGNCQGGIERLAFAGGSTTDYVYVFPTQGIPMAIGKPVFYVATKTSFQYGTIAAGGSMLVGVSILDVANPLQLHGIGIAGSGSLTNFCVQRDSGATRTFTNMGVAIDTLPHFFEIWGDGTNIFGRIDGGAVVTCGAYDAFTAQSYPCRALSMGGSAIGSIVAAKTDWAYFACQALAF